MPVYALYERNRAEQVAPLVELLRDAGLVCFVDPVDSARMAPGNIRVLISDRVRSSNHLILFHGEEEASTWWVPLAIGAAQVCRCRVVGFRFEPRGHHPCLTDLPEMHQRDDLLSFIECYRQDASVPFSESRNTLQPLDSPDQFYRKLRSALRRPS